MESNSPQTDVLRLPDLLSLCEGFTLRRSPHYARAAAETRRWLVAHDVLGAQTLALFAAADMELLAARCYPSAPYAAFGTVCDYLCLLVAIDELSDAQTGVEARRTGASLVDALRDPRCDDGTTIAALTIECVCRYVVRKWRRSAGCRLRARLGEWVHTPSFARFVDACERYVAATAREAELRERGEVLGLADYKALRRENSAMRPCLAIMEFALGISLPDRVHENEHFTAVYWAVGDMVCWANDIYSYSAERAAGLAGNNYMTVLMKEKNLSLQEAGDYVGAHFKCLIDRYSGALRALRAQSFGDPQLDQDVERLTGEMANWVIGNIIWSFECRRYFGDESEEVKRTQCVLLDRAPLARARLQGRN